MNKRCIYCAEQACILLEENSITNCVFNIVIYENEEKILMYNIPEKKIFKIKRGEGIKEIDFKEAIRQIDTIPEKEPDWKRLQILNLAKELGIFG